MNDMLQWNLKLKYNARNYMNVAVNWKDQGQGRILERNLTGSNGDVFNTAHSTESA